MRARWMAPGPWAVLAGFAQHAWLRWHAVLADMRMLTRLQVLASLRMRADANALTNPDRAGAEHAAQLASARQIGAVAGAQREVLVIARQVTDGATAVACVPAQGRRGRPGAGIDSSCAATAGSRESVVGIGPGSGLLRIVARRAHPRCELRQLVAASLADGGERY